MNKNRCRCNDPDGCIYHSTYEINFNSAYNSGYNQSHRDLESETVNRNNLHGYSSESHSWLTYDSNRIPNERPSARTSIREDYSYRDYSKLTDQQKPSGLKNNGYICYVNSTIQCLSHIKLFRDRIIRQKQSTSDKMIYSLANLLELLYEKSDDVNKAHTYFLGQISDIAVLNQQSDMFEFLTKLLNKIKISTNDSSLIKMFETQKQITYSCLNYYCKHTLIKEEQLLFLILPFSFNSSARRLSLQTYVDRLEESFTTSWTCKKCSQNAKVLVKTEFISFPEILMVRLKSNSSHFVPVEYSSKLIVQANKKTPINYDLISVIYHFGNFHSGHYTACVKTENGKWYYLNDSNVTVAKEEQIYRPNDAFVLFYKKSSFKY